jgi:hypothetical protein
MIVEQVQMWAGLIVVVSAAILVVWKAISPVWKKTKKVLNNLDLFTRDWFGEEAAPGRDKVPGVMERLNNIDGELKHNGGTTMKDAIKRIENKLKLIDSRLKEGDETFARIEEKLEK